MESIETIKATTLTRMKSEILEDMAEGRVPSTCSCFGDLHDHVDANEYGGFCDDEWVDPMIARFGGRDPIHEGTPEAYIAFLDECQCEIDAWLKAGRP